MAFLGRGAEIPIIIDDRILLILILLLRIEKGIHRLLGRAGRLMASYLLREWIYLIESLCL